MAGKKARKPADGSYSTAWRNVSKIILRPGISLMMGLDFAGLEHIPAQGPVIGKLGQLPVFRGQADAALVLRQAAQLVAKTNSCVIFYPEASCTRDPDLWPMVAKTGVARLALESGVPVVPIAHWGAQRILPYGKWVPKFLPRTTVRLVAGPPVDLSEFEGQAMTNQVLRAGTDKIMTEIASMLGGLRGEQPPAEFYHPAVARRKLRQDLRALQEADDRGTPAP